MPEKPLLIFPDYTVANRHKLPSGFGSSHLPSPEQQVKMLQPKFEQLKVSFDSMRVEMSDDPVGVEPEQVLVLETVGSVEDFYNAVRKLEGLEWLAEMENDDILPDEDFYVDEKHKEKMLSGRVYLIFSNYRGLEEMLSLWKKYMQDPHDTKFRKAYAKWKNLFDKLKDIRPWGPEDRLFETGLWEDWQERENAGEERMRVEIELWYRQSNEKRKRVEHIVKQLVYNSNGRVVGQTCCIDSIAYYAVLVELPIQKVKDMLNDNSIRLVRCNDIMFFRPVGQALVNLPEKDDLQQCSDTDITGNVNGEPVVALLDGYPLENHRLLAGRLIVDDPEDWATECPVGDRRHGTAMASLIIHGELDGKEKPINRPVYVFPILKPDLRYPEASRVEYIPEDNLPVDLVHRVVLRIFENINGQSAVAPSVKIINLSVGDTGRLFDRFLSPWARLLDYLSFKYNVLFIVSAGNHPQSITLDVHRKDLEKLQKEPALLEKEVFTAIVNDSRNRRLLSPAEAINALTVGALHDDSSQGYVLGRRINPYISSCLPSPISSQGAGFRRSVKPDILLRGGKQTYFELLGNTHDQATIVCNLSAVAPGQRVASPGIDPGNVEATIYSRGTSNAAALLTHTAAILYDKIQELINLPNGNRLDDGKITVLLKALLVHGASWREANMTIASLLDIKDKKSLKSIITRLMGYGVILPERVYECENHRATLIGCGSLTDGGAHRYTVPLPPSLSGQKVWRSLIVTLAYLTPVNPFHRAYRNAALWFEAYGLDKTHGNSKELLKVDRKEVDWRGSRRGTVQHEIFSGDKATAFVDGDEIFIQVNCRAEAGKLNANVPYALAVTLEVEEKVGLPIYEEVRLRLRERVSVPISVKQ